MPDSDLKIDLKIDYSKIKLNAPLIILAISTLLGIYFVSPLAKNGVLVNIDHSSHYSRIACLANSEMLAPSNWCPEWQAGFPTSSYYYPIIDTLVVLLSKIIGFSAAYKFFVVLALFIPAFGAYLLLRVTGRKLAGAFAYALVLLNPGSWHIGGFEEVFLVGMWPQVLSSGFFLMSVALFIDFFKNPSKKKLVIAAASTVFMTHPFTLVASGMVFSLLVLLQWNESKKKIKWLAAFFSLVFLFNAYYSIPLALNLADLMPKDSSKSMDFFHFKAYLWDKISWHILLTALLGMFVAFLSKSREKTPFLIYSTSILMNFALSFVKFLDGPWFIGIRMETFVAPVIFMYSALFFEFISTLSIKHQRKKFSLGLVLALILFTVSIVPMAKQTHIFSKSMLLIPEDELSSLYGPLRHLPEGRILIEETLYNSGQTFLSFTHLHLLVSVYSGKEMVGLPFFYPVNRRLITTEQGQLFGKKLTEYSSDELNYTLSHNNIRYVLAHTPWYISFFDNISLSKNPLGPFYVFETNISPGYFEIDGGNVLSQRYEGIYGKADVLMDREGTLAMKVNPFSNWKAFVDGVPVKISTCDWIICVNLEPGEHSVEFKYGYNWANYVGYLLSIFAIAISLFILLKRH